MGISTRVVLLAVFFSLFAGRLFAQAEFIRGDVNGDGVVSLADAQAIAAWQFRFGDPSRCLAASDVNADSKQNIGDAIYLINHLLGSDLHMMWPPFPQPGACDFIGECHCESYGGGSPLLDPAAKLELADTEIQGGDTRRARITVKLTSSESIGSYIGTLVDEAGVIDNGPDGKREYGPDSVVDFTGFTDRFGMFRATATGNRITFVFFTSIHPVSVPPLDDAPVLEISVCLKPGTPAGSYPLSLESGELADYETSRAIYPRLSGGTLTVLGAVGDSPCIPEGSNHDVRFQLADTTGRRGQDATVPLSVKTNRGAQGIQLSLGFDGEVLEATGIDTAWARPDGQPFELALYNLGHDSLGGYFIAAIPSEQISLPVNENVHFLDLRFQVRPEAAQGQTELRFQVGAKAARRPDLPTCFPEDCTYCLKDAWGTAQCYRLGSYRNFLASGGAEVTPEVAESFILIDGFMTIVGDVSFFRSDANGDAQVDISDAVFTLGFLYQGGKPPPCREAADANGDGAVDISDPIVMLRDLFLNPGAPLSHCELDGTQSALGCDDGPACRP
jgi:dockerin type I repeat protein